MRNEVVDGVRRAGRTLATGMVLLLVLGSGAADAQSGYGYAGMSGGSNTLVVFDLATGTALLPPIDLSPEGNYPYDATLTPQGHELWVVGASGDGVVVIDTATNAVTARIPLVGIAEYPEAAIVPALSPRFYVL